MSQHDYNIANQGFPNFRTDLNNALGAIATNNSGSTAPTTTFAHQWWLDTSTTPNTLRIRNADNDAWVVVGTVNQTADTFDLSTTVNGLALSQGAGSVATNTAVGASALAANTTGANNTAVGYQAGDAITTGVGNTALGSGALGANTTANNNTALGYNALLVNTTGANNVAVGYGALDANTTGVENVAVGWDSLGANTTGSYNVAVGRLALQLNTTARYNTAVGNFALGNNTTAEMNTAIGANALDANTTGANNTALGAESLGANTTGANNTAVGYQALNANTTGSRSTAVGVQAGYSVSTNDAVTAVGYFAGYSATGGFSTFFGRNAGYLSTAGSSTFIGDGAGSEVTSGAKNTILGRYNGNQDGLDIRTANNHIVLSDGDGNPRLVINNNNEVKIPGIYALTSAQAANVYTDAGGFLYRSTSSLKYKRDIQNATHGLAEVMHLRPVTYKGKSENDGETIFGGLIAEEVHAAGLTEFVQYNNAGEPDALAYGNMVSLLVKAIQELKAEIDQLKGQ